MLFGVGGARAELRAGAAIADITPGEGVSINGVVMQIGPIKRVHDPLHARAVVLDDGKTSLAIVVCDLTMISRDVFDHAKRLIQEQSGIDPKGVLISATHTHSATRAVHVGTTPADDEYHRHIARQVAAAVAEAHGRLAPAEVGWGAADFPKYAVSRRYIMKDGAAGPDPFGGTTDVVKMGGSPRDKRVRASAPVDTELYVLSVRHADGRPLALVVNYGTHYAGGYVSGEVSADYFGYFSRYVEEALSSESDRAGLAPVVGMMTNATSGDVNTDGKNRGYKPYEFMEKLGQETGDVALGVYKKIKHTRDVDLAAADVDLELRIRQPSPERLEWARAKWMLAEPKVNGGKTPSRPEIYAREQIWLHEHAELVKVKLQALRIGSLGIGAMPCEVFSETGLFIKGTSPLESTFNVSLANDYAGYLPTR
ncbi:MAG: hypothetical protein ACYTGQ_10270, partial [Planctomycetota bacterium]